MKTNPSTTLPFSSPKLNLTNISVCFYNYFVDFATKYGRVWKGCGRVLEGFLNLLEGLEGFLLHLFKKRRKRVNSNNIATIGETLPTLPTLPEVFC